MVLLIIFGVILVICFIYYILTLRVRRENKEILKRVFLLYEEELEAEKVKQNARIAGKMAIESIDKIAGIK